MNAYVCESCGTTLHYKGRKFPYCPVCRGMMLRREMDTPKEVKHITCPKCGEEFSIAREPFKCPFCDYNFSVGAYW